MTTSPAEAGAIVRDCGPYKFSSKEVLLSGLPRHDALLAGSDTTEKLVIIMPTWRRWLMGTVLGRGSKRALNPDFPSSEYAERWRSFLHSSRLRDLATRHGYRVVFFPHANVQPYLGWFDAPSHIEVMRHHGEGSIQELFRRAALMVTDYSSVAFEMAYLRKPVVCYQFDKERMFQGTHTTRQGYFDYERDGFGPVATDEDELLSSLDALLERGGAPSAKYLERMERTFAFRDGGCCRRVFEAISDLDRAATGRAPSDAIVIEAARAASRHGDWALAESRWERVLALPAAAHPAEAMVELAKAKRHLGKVAEAELLLEGAASQIEPDLETRRELAELATA
ncbi:MAG: CDP-glycerol glycerophosphotransferase family protein, partial [Polyangiaceae bacterium]|nr:CDP-glycerol glycerophosphotransferase family protein [Polyangiaceae bacterium]